MSGRLTRLTDRLRMGGAPSEEMARDLAQTMASGAYEMDEVLPRLAWTLAQCAHAREAVVWLRVGNELRPAASWPDRTAHAPIRVKGEDPPPIPRVTRAFPVVDRGELMGVLSVSRRAGSGAHSRLPSLQGDRLSAAEERAVEDLCASAALVLRNVRLIADLRASRQRIVAAADEERRKVERNLHDGAQQRLLALSMALNLVRSGVGRDPEEALAAGLDEAIAELRLALADLRDLAHGIHPAILTEAGLEPALRSLAERSSVPARLLQAPEGRYEPTVEATVYYVVAEALANVAKYAEARSVTIRAVRDGDRIRVEVGDDGVGGADPARGSGLRGLLDRVAAVGGRLEIESPRGGGTTLTAEVPCR
jgi:signal transduction histidine kinase